MVEPDDADCSRIVKNNDLRLSRDFGLRMFRTIVAFLLGPAKTNSANPFAEIGIVFITSTSSKTCER